MKRFITVTISILTAILLAACGQGAGSNTATQNHNNKTAAQVKSISFNKGTLNVPSGKIKITNTYNLALTDPKKHATTSKVIIVTGTFTNKSFKPTTAVNFFNGHLTVNQLTHDRALALENDGVQSPTRFSQPLAIGKKANVFRGHSVHFAIGWQLVGGRFSKRLKIVAHKTGNTKPGSYTVTPKSQSERSAGATPSL